MGQIMLNIEHDSSPRWGLKFQLQSDTAQDLPGVGVGVPRRGITGGATAHKIEKEGQRSGGV